MRGDCEEEHRLTALCCKIGRLQGCTQQDAAGLLLTRPRQHACTSTSGDGMHRDGPLARWSGDLPVREGSVAVISRLSAPRSWLCPANFWVVSMTCDAMCPQFCQPAVMVRCRLPTSVAWLEQACHICMLSLGMLHRWVM